MSALNDTNTFALLHQQRRPEARTFCKSDTPSLCPPREDSTASLSYTVVAQSSAAAACSSATDESKYSAVTGVSSPPPAPSLLRSPSSGLSDFLSIERTSKSGAPSASPSPPPISPVTVTITVDRLLTRNTSVTFLMPRYFDLWLQQHEIDVLKLKIHPNDVQFNSKSMPVYCERFADLIPGATYKPTRLGGSGYGTAASDKLGGSPIARSCTIIASRALRAPVDVDATLALTSCKLLQPEHLRPLIDASVTGGLLGDTHQGGALLGKAFAAHTAGILADTVRNTHMEIIKFGTDTRTEIIKFGNSTCNQCLHIAMIACGAAVACTTIMAYASAKSK